jgi:hypothetical protein
VALSRECRGGVNKTAERFGIDASEVAGQDHCGKLLT